MQRPTIDLRSDTVTRPTPGMRRAMAEAEVGDDVFGDDPTVKALEARTAELLGKEAAVFVPSGTMANQIGVGVNTQPGDEVLCAATSHVYVWEAGGIARLSGVTARPFAGDGGILSLDDLRDAIRPGRPPLRPHPAGLPGEHAQPRRRARAPDGERRRDRPVGARAQPGHAPGRRPADERRGGVGAAGARVGAALRHGLDLLLQGPGRAGGLGAGRIGRGDPQGAPAPQALRRRDAPGGDPRRGGALCPRASRRPPGRRPRPCPAAGRGVRGDRGLRAGIRAGRDEPGLGRWSTASLGTAAEVAAYLRSHGILVSVLGPQVLRACTHLDVSREQVEYVAGVIRQIEPAMVSAVTLVY